MTDGVRGQEGHLAIASQDGSPSLQSAPSIHRSIDIRDRPAMPAPTSVAMCTVWRASASRTPRSTHDGVMSSPTSCRMSCRMASRGEGYSSSSISMGLQLSKGFYDSSCTTMTSCTETAAHSACPNFKGGAAATLGGDWGDGGADLEKSDLGLMDSTLCFLRGPRILAGAPLGKVRNALQEQRHIAWQSQQSPRQHGRQGPGAAGTPRLGATGQWGQADPSSPSSDRCRSVPPQELPPVAQAGCRPQTLNQFFSPAGKAKGGRAQGLSHRAAQPGEKLTPRMPQSPRSLRPANARRDGKARAADEMGRTGTERSGRQRSKARHPTGPIHVCELAKSCCRRPDDAYGQMETTQTSKVEETAQAEEADAGETVERTTARKFSRAARAPLKPAESVKFTEKLTVFQAYDLAEDYNLPIGMVTAAWKRFKKYDSGGKGVLTQIDFQLLLRAVLRERYPCARDVPPALFLRTKEVESATFITFLTWLTENSFSEYMILTAEQRWLRNLARKFGTPFPEVEEVKATFDKFDEDGSGQMDFDEFTELMHELLDIKDATLLPKSRLMSFWREIDDDGSGVAEFSEFIPWYLGYFAKGNKESSPMEEFYRKIRPVPGTSSSRD